MGKNELTPLGALKRIKKSGREDDDFGWLSNEYLFNKEIKVIEQALKRLEELEKAFDALSKEDEKAKKLLSKEIEKNRALNEILALHDKWLGNEMSDFEFFTLLSEIKDKYSLSKEVLL